MPHEISLDETGHYYMENFRVKILSRLFLRKWQATLEGTFLCRCSFIYPNSILHNRISLL